MKKNLIIAVLVLFVGSAAMADAVVAYEAGGSTILRLVDDETAALGSFTNLGSGITVNGITPLANGNFAAAYDNGTTHYVRIYNGTTMAPGSVANLGSSDVTNIVGLANGDFAITYGASNYLRHVNGETAALGSLTVMGSTVTVNGLTALANGNVAAAYEVDATGVNLARIYDGTTMAPGSLANLGTSDVTNIVGLANGDFAISYHADNYLRLADGETAALGSLSVMGSTVTVSGLTALANGNVAAAYEANSTGTNYARIYDGTTMAPGNYASTGTSDITNVAGLANGDFAIAYNGNIVRLVDGETAVLGSYSVPGTIVGLAGDFVVSEATSLLEGDANRDGVVSAGDYASVQSSFGNTGEPGIPGDANGDGVVSAGDYASVQANFGNTAPAEVVPEPATLSLLGLGLLTLVRRRKR